MPELSHLDHLVLTVTNMDAATGFYCGTLGMRIERFRAADGSNRTALLFGRQKINLHVAGAEFLPNARRATPGSADLCFLSNTPIADWIAHLTESGVQIEEGPVPRTGAMGPILSIYVRDPDGNLIEISNPA